MSPYYFLPIVVAVLHPPPFTASPPLTLQGDGLTAHIVKKKLIKFNKEYNIILMSGKYPSDLTVSRAGDSFISL